MKHLSATWVATQQPDGTTTMRMQWADAIPNNSQKPLANAAAA